MVNKTDVNISISAMPPFVSLNLNLPLEKVIGSISKHKVNHSLIGGLISWSIDRILSDQYTRGDAAGAWSKEYPKYIDFIYGQTRIPDDISVRDSITFSSWISSALAMYVKSADDKDLTNAILPRLLYFHQYLKRHYNSQVGGFGLTTRPTSRGSTNINVDLRHTLWAVLSLWNFELLDSHDESIIIESCSFIRKEMENIIIKKERAITFAVLHKIITTNDLSRLIYPSEVKRYQMQKRIESVLVEKYDPIYSSWDLDSDPMDSARIDNILFVLSSINVSSCVDDELMDILDKSIDALYEKGLIEVDKEKLALPFYDNGNPNLGATLQFLWILLKNMDCLDISKKKIEKLLNFVVDPESRRRDQELVFTWHLASSLLLATL